MNPQNLVIILLVLGFFSPPILLGQKKIYSSELVLFFWTIFTIPSLILHLKRIHFPRNLLSPYLFSIAATLLLLIAYLHGQFRPALSSEILTYLPEIDKIYPFSWLQDGIIFGRYLLWLYSITTALVFAEIDIRQKSYVIKPLTILKTWTYLALVESIIAFVAYYGPVRNLMGSIYGYNPNYHFWMNRLFGTFTSPHELAAALVPGTLGWILFLEKKKSLMGYLALSLCIGAIIKSNSFSILMGFLFALPAMHWHRKPELSKKITGLVLLLLMILISVIVALRIIEIPTFVDTFVGLQDKFRNLVFRLGPWQIFIETLASRVDHFLFGLGFARVHCDQSFLLIWRTGGLFLLYALLYAISKAFLTLHKSLITNSHDQVKRWALGCLVTLCTAGLFTDALTFRVGGILMFLSIAFVISCKKISSSPLK